jgi:hypothetical protein
VCSMGGKKQREALPVQEISITAMTGGRLLPLGIHLKRTTEISRHRAQQKSNKECQGGASLGPGRRKRLQQHAADCSHVCVCIWASCTGHSGVRIAIKKSQHQS